jgi:hypothetical protein
MTEPTPRSSLREHICGPSHETCYLNPKAKLNFSPLTEDDLWHKRSVQEHEAGKCNWKCPICRQNGFRGV